MSARKLIKTVFNQANRSGFHTLVAPVRHRHHPSQAEFDALGGVIVVGLSICVALCIRLILTN